MDSLTKERRSALMGRVRQRDTGPETITRSILHALGLRFRLHDRTLPGRPDIVLRRHKTVVFVHGCFWHRHADCRLATTPKSSVAFWQAKFASNVARDARVDAALRDSGWRVLVVWECETRQAALLRARLARAFSVVSESSTRSRRRPAGTRSKIGVD